MSSYVGLHVHSDFSFLDGLQSIPGMVQRAVDLGQKAVALTDHGEVAGHLMLQKEAKKAGIKPLFGMEGYLFHDVEQARRDKLKASQNSHITLVAKSEKGLRNLWAWSSEAYTRGFYHKPNMDWESVKPYAQDIIATDGCMMSFMAQAAIEDNEDELHELMTKYMDTFGDNFRMELHTWQFTDPKTENQHDLNAKMRKINQTKVELATQYSIPLIVVNDAHFSTPEDWVKHDLVWKMNTRANPDQMDERGPTAAWIMGDDEVVYWMNQHGIPEDITREAIMETSRIADSCDVEIKGDLRMPRISPSEEEDLNLFLDHLEDGFERKLGHLPTEQQDLYAERMETEINLIIEKHFHGYFNVVADYVKHAKGQGWTLTPGRGSSGGSLVTYLLDITAVDPLKYDLLFERFLSIDRSDFPDIDTDFPKSKLPLVKQYLAQKYGEDNVCTIGTITTSEPKSILKDLGRALQVPFGDSEAISKAIPDATDWDKGVKSNTALAPFKDRHRDLFTYGEQMVGRARNSGTHASGFLISSDPLLGDIPLRQKRAGSQPGALTTAFSDFEVEELGFIKFDLLGLIHDDIVGTTLDIIEERHGIRYHPEDFGDEQYKDPAIWESVCQGDTVGLFQLSANLMTQTAKRFKPQDEEECALLLAANRPGVIDAGQLEPLIERKHGRQTVSYDHPMLEEHLSETYGIIVYQEQMMKISRSLAGFTGSQAEWLRGVIGKKKVEQIPEAKRLFYEGCKANPEFMEQARDPERAIEKIWASFEASGLYAFNKCAFTNTEVHLGDGKTTMTIGDMWRRLHDLAPVGTAVPGEPCRYGCDKPAAPKGRGQCKSCVAWRTKFNSATGTYAMALDSDGRLRPKRIKDVHRNGVREGFKVTLENGRSITATANHRHRTPDGWKRVDELSVGDELVCLGEYETHQYEPGMWNTTKAEPSYAGAKLSNSKRQGKSSLGYRDGGYLRLAMWTKTAPPYCEVEGCGATKETHRLERAHLDGDRTNNSPHNLRMMCVSHHKAYDYQNNNRRRRYEKGIPAVTSRIVSITPAGEEMTFDLEMDDPGHNWVGNGIVTHNSHSVGYSILASWEAWLKHYYPAEFLTALLIHDEKNFPAHVRYTKGRGIAILPPDVNTSGETFTLTDEGIRYGLGAVRQVGEKPTNAIVKEREEGGPFTSLEDFLNRVPKGSANKAVVTHLIQIGAFDSLNPDRAALQVEFYDIRKVKEADRAELPDYSDSLAGYRLEKHLIGGGITYNLLEPYEDMIEAECATTEEEVDSLFQNQALMVGGLITKVTTTKTKREGKPMGFVELAFRGTDFRFVVFPEAWAKYRSLLEVDAPVIVMVSGLGQGNGANVIEVERLDGE